MKSKHLFVLGLICVVLLFGLWARHRDPQRSSQFQTLVRFSKIGNAIEHYTWDHQGNLPSKLSDLVPQYIGVSQLSVFYPTGIPVPVATNSPTDLHENIRLIDTSSDCIYLGAAGIAREVIAFERVDKKNHGSNAWYHIIPPGGGVDAITAMELDDLLKTNESPVLDRLRREDVMYYEGNLHASLNGYRLDFGSYPLGDNASIIRVLKGDNPAKRAYHSRYVPESNVQGEDLDPWGTPYLMASDGHKVRIKSAGRNRQFDQLGSTNYDDLCFSFTNGSPIGDGRPF